jgi:hypothetical protein
MDRLGRKQRKLEAQIGDDDHKPKAAVECAWRRGAWVACAAASILSFPLIAGCGGGGRGGESAPRQVTVGGTVSGLAGTVVLQDNAGNDLTLATNGAFTFPSAIDAGSTYAVTVLKQPAGPSCAVSNGSGTAIADVTNVSVICTVDPSTTFLPLIAYPETSGGATGLFVISSKSVSDQPVQITTEAVSSLGLAFRYTVGASGTLSSASPYALRYNTVNARGGDHVWSLGLSGASTLVPTQLSSLTIPYHTQWLHGVFVPVQVCRWLEIPKNLNDPNSDLLILALPTDTVNLCKGDRASFKWLLIHSSDGPNTAPVNLPLTDGQISPLYQPTGGLAGLVMLDYSSSTLNYYPDETFTNPVALLRNVATFFGSLQNGYPFVHVPIHPGYVFLAVQPLSNGAAPYSVYRVDYSGSISADLYDFHGSLLGSSSLFDSGSPFAYGGTYFLDFVSNGSAQTESIGEIPDSGGAGQILYTSATDGTFPHLDGVSGGYLVLTTSAGDVQTLATGMPGTPTTIASYGTAASLEVSLAAGDVFVTKGTQGLEPVSTEILNATGNVLQPLMPASAFISIGAPVMQLKSITDASGVGGGALYALDLSQPASPNAVPLKSATGATFILPDNMYVAGVTPVSPTFGFGEPRFSIGGSILWAYDLVKGVAAPITVPNTSLTVVWY